MAEENKNQAAAKSQFTDADRFRVEIADDKNRRVMWPLDNKLLRGRILQGQFNGQPDERFASMPDLPGIIIEVDPAKKTISYLDPLNFKSNKELLRKAQSVMREFTGERYGPEADRVRPASPDELKTAAFFCRRLLDNKTCIERSGKVPEMEVLMKWPGRCGANLFSESTVESKYRKPDAAYVKPSDPEVKPVISYGDEREVAEHDDE